MPTPETFLEATQWMGIATLALAALATLGFVLQWGLRFRLVGAAGFSAVLTVGLFGLSFEPLLPAAVPGALPYTTVFDSGATQIVIKVPQTITATELDATLQQAAKNLFRASRLGRSGQQPTIRARTLVHKPDDASELVYVGEVQPRPGDNDNPLSVKIYNQQLAKANAAAA
ncbi:MAG: Ycf51 family protein [Cyanobacteria bacterium P01_A01_bin.114]